MNNINYSLSFKMGKFLTESGLKLAVAESCTGGGLANEITAVPGSSNYFDRGFVTYTNESKCELLGVPMKLIETQGAVSAEVAEAMAKGVLAHSHADIAVSITGIAGPEGGSVDKPVGLVWFALADSKGFCESRKMFFGGGRKAVRRQSIGFVLEWVIKSIIVKSINPFS